MERASSKNSQPISSDIDVKLKGSNILFAVLSFTYGSIERQSSQSERRPLTRGRLTA